MAQKLNYDRTKGTNTQKIGLLRQILSKYKNLFILMFYLIGLRQPIYIPEWTIFGEES